MSYFDEATFAIACIGNYGDFQLEGEEFSRDDRSKRIEAAANALCDFVYEHPQDRSGEEPPGMGIFTQEHLPVIARMVAIGMMAQSDRDLEMEGKLVAALVSDKDNEAQQQLNL